MTTEPATPSPEADGRPGDEPMHYADHGVAGGFPHRASDCAGINVAADLVPVAASKDDNDDRPGVDPVRGSGEEPRDGATEGTRPPADAAGAVAQPEARQAVDHAAASGEARRVEGRWMAEVQPAPISVVPTGQFDVVLTDTVGGEEAALGNWLTAEAAEALAAQINAASGEAQRVEICGWPESTGCDQTAYCPEPTPCRVHPRCLSCGRFIWLGFDGKWKHENGASDHDAAWAGDKITPAASGEAQRGWCLGTQTFDGDAPCGDRNPHPAHSFLTAAPVVSADREQLPQPGVVTVPLLVDERTQRPVNDPRSDR